MEFRDEPSYSLVAAWRRRYEDAWRETDNAALVKKIEVAEAAMSVRRHALTNSVEHGTESRAIDEATTDLRVLRKERLNV
jgi:hypothetical protein